MFLLVSNMVITTANEVLLLAFLSILRFSNLLSTVVHPRTSSLFRWHLLFRLKYGGSGCDRCERRYDACIFFLPQVPLVLLIQSEFDVAFVFMSKNEEKRRICDAWMLGFSQRRVTSAEIAL